MANTKHAVVTRESLNSEWNGKGRLSGIYKPASVEAAIENGNVVLIEGLIEGERELHKLGLVAANTPLTKVGLVTTPEVMADERKRNLSDFINESGAPITVDKLVDGDIFSLTAEGFDGDLAVGKIVELQAKSKLKAATTLTSGSTKIGTIIDFANGKYAIRVGQ